MSSCHLRNTGSARDGTALAAASIARADFAHESSKNCATSTGEYFPLALPDSSSAACSSTEENISGSSGLTVPNRLGDGVSLYGTRPPSAIGMFGGTSTQYSRFDADG